MEHKIGEIFELGGEWYQCVESDGTCNGCAGEFSHCSFCYGFEECVGKIFKKLEKVGEPYELNSHLVQKYRFFHNPAIQVNGICILETINTDKIIEIGIKQTQKDMEDLDKIKVRDYTKVEELNVMEENKLNLKPFDIQKAREGKLVCTRDGRKARIICFDGKGDQPIIALVEAKGNKDALIEKVERYFINGHSVFEVRETNNDLMMLPEKKRDG